MCDLHYRRLKSHGNPLEKRKPLKPLKDRLLEKVDVSESGCWNWTGSKLPITPAGRGGYGTIGIGPAVLGKGYVHRVSYEIHVGPIPDGLYVLHACDNRLCVNPSHLFLGTAKDNAADAARKGRMGRGEQSKTAKLSEADVLRIRHRLDRGESQKSIAADFGVSQGQISNIRSRKAWSHI